jgi:hypothetical protein
VRLDANARNKIKIRVTEPLEEPAQLRLGGGTRGPQDDVIDDQPIGR